MTTWRDLARCVAPLAILSTAAFVVTLATPVAVFAQEATVSGTVADATGGALPGVSIVATHTSSGNTFAAVTDENGAFRIAVRTGMYQITAELSGFGSVTRRVELLVGQNAVVKLEMALANLQENVTVTAQAPLIDLATSAIASNVDATQMKELPLNGRNFVDLTMLAAGSRQNASSDELGGLGSFQLNVDGLRVTQNQTAGFGQPKYSRDAIAEFEFVSNRFDATQGGSSGTIVNAITKSGANNYAGTFSGYFRDDNFIAKDFVQNRVLPYQDQQMSVTYGGPIKKDMVHFFANYEAEREPQTFSFSSPYPTFNIDQSGTRIEHKGGGRLDFQLSPTTHFTIRGNKSLNDMPYDSRYSGGSNRHPSSSITTDRHSTDVSGFLTQVLTPTAFNEIRGGYAGYYWIQDSVVAWPDHPYPGLDYGTPIINMRSYTIGQAHAFSHEDERQGTWSIRDNLTLAYDKAGRHDLKVGGEGFYQRNPVFLCIRCMGVYDATGGPIPSNIEQLFPVWDDVSTWNIGALSPITRSYTLGVGEMQQQAPLMGMAAWIQDDWRVGPRLTLNLGMRYDLEDGVYAEDVELQPWIRAGRSNDMNNLGPRIGGAFQVDERTVVRGGAGRYFSDPGSHTAYWTMLNTYALQAQVFNDGRADFAANPFNGPTPTFEEVLTTLCTVSSAPNCLRRSMQTSYAVEGDEIPYSTQASLGVQRQFGSTMALEADYVYNANRAGLVTMNANLAYNPATGINYPYSDLTKRPYPQWGDVSVRRTIGESNYHALQMAFTKRMSNGWQASATYLLSAQWNLQNAPTAGAFCENPTTLSASGPNCDVPVTLHPSMKEEWYLSGEQRNRLTFNGIWEAGLGFQFSGLYFYGDQGKATPTAGVDPLQTGSTNGRVRADGSLIERNSFDIPSMHRVDVRMQKRFRLGNTAAIDGIVEVFNAFNHANYQSFTLSETSAKYGQPTESTNVSYQPRMLQFGFRATF